MLNIWNNTIVKYIAFLLVIGIIPLLTIGFVSYQKSSLTLQQAENQFSKALQRSQKELLNLQLDQIESLIENITGVEDITNSLDDLDRKADAYTDLVTKARIGYILNGYLNLEGLISIDIFTERGAHFHVGETLNVSEVRRETKDKIKSESIAAERHVYWAGVVPNVNMASKHEYVLTAARVIYVTDRTNLKRRPVGLLLVNYNLDFLYTLFGKIRSRENSTEYLLDQNRNIVYSSNYDEIGSPSSGLITKIFDNGVLPQQLVWNEAPYLIQNLPLPELDWVLLSIVPKQSLLEGVRSIREVTIYLIVFGLFIVLFAALFFSRRVIRPLRDVIGGFQQLENGTLDFDKRLPVTSNNEIGELVKWFNSFMDNLRQRKKVEVALEKAKNDAEQANQAKSDFLANMSHEIRTPMNAVIGMTNLLMDSKLSREQRSTTKVVQRSAESLLNLINDILDFSKVEAGKLELEPVDFDMGRLISEFGAAITFRSNEKGLELICPADPVQCQWFYADSGRIRQILTNLVNNAIKFTEKGEVAVHYRVLAQNDKKTQLRIDVIDTGIGLSRDQKERLFGRFVQADASTTRKYGGTGLGLAICKELVHLMGGEIGVESELNRGAIFWFTLDLKNSKQQHTPPEQTDLKEQKILVVDDNATNRSLMGKLFTHWQMEYELTDSEEMALDSLQSAADENSPFTVAIIDTQVGDVKGIELGAEIKSRLQLMDTHLIILSAQGQRGDAEKYARAGFVGYLSKPIEQSALYNTLLRITGASGNFLPDTPLASHERLPQFNANVLVVEDNITNQIVAKGILNKYGLSIELASNGEEALQALRQRPFDLVFMDCQMPVLDGYSATRQIRDPQSKVKDSSIPIIAMTANAMQGDREKCTAAGMDDYLSKPIDPLKLNHMLKRWLPNHGVASSISQAPSECDGYSKEAVVSPKETVPTESCEEPVFDQAALCARVMGDEALIQILIDTFVESAQEQIENLKAAIAAEDVSQVSAIAHKLRGSSANMGGMALSEQAFRIEQSCSLEAQLAAIPELDARLKQLREEMGTASLGEN